MTAGRALCVVWRCHPRVASFDRTERSIRTLCVSAAEAPSSFKRCKTSRQVADATNVNCVWALSEGPVGLERAAVIQGEVAMVRPFRVFLRKEVDFLLFEMFCVVGVLAFRGKCRLGVLACSYTCLSYLGMFSAPRGRLGGNSP